MDRDVNLINTTLSGDKSAFGTIVSLYQKKVYRFVYRIINNSFDAADIVQETFVNAYQNLDQLKDRDKFSIWLFQIAKNRCVDWIRKRQSNLLAIEDELSNERLYLPPAPDEILIERETYEHIMKAILKLPERSRRAVEMFYLEGRSYSEIQNELGITKGTLGRWLYKARLDLRRSSRQFINAVTFWLNDGVYHLAKLVSKSTGIISNVSTVSIVKCLVISMAIHLIIFAQLSGDGTGHNKNGVSYKSSAIQAYILDQAKLDHILPNSQAITGLGSRFSGMKAFTKRQQIIKALEKRNISQYNYHSGKLKAEVLSPVSNTKSIIPDYQSAYIINDQYSTPLLYTNTDNLHFSIQPSNQIRVKNVTKPIIYGQKFSASSGLSGVSSDSTQKPSTVISEGANEYVLVRTWPEKPEKDKMGFPSKMALDNSGHIYVTDMINNRIYKLTLEGELLTTWGSKGNGEGQFKWLYGIAVDSSGNVYVADSGNYRIQKFDSNGKFIKKWGTKGYVDKSFYDGYALKRPIDIAIDDSGNIFVADSESNCIVKFNSDGIYQHKWGEKGSRDGRFRTPISIAVNSSGNIYVADQENHRIQKFSSNGVFQCKWGTIGTDAGEFKYFSGITVDKFGNVFVADNLNHCIQKFDTNGVLLAKWGKRIAGYDSHWIGKQKPEPDDGFIGPSDIDVDDQGNIYVLDSYRIKIFRPVRK